MKGINDHKPRKPSVLDGEIDQNLSAEMSSMRTTVALLLISILGFVIVVVPGDWGFTYTTPLRTSYVSNRIVGISVGAIFLALALLRAAVVFHQARR